MKTSIKLALLLLIAVLVIAAAQIGNSGAEKSACYTQEEVKILMDNNGWTEEQSIYVLELSCGLSPTAPGK